MSAMQSGFNAITSEPRNRPVIQRFTRAAIAVALIPLSVFFLVYYAVSSLNLPTHPLLSPLTLSGLAAVVTVNVVISVFAALALYEDLNAQAGSAASTSTPPAPNDRLISSTATISPPNIGSNSPDRMQPERPKTE